MTTYRKYIYSVFDGLKINERMVVDCEQGTRVGSHRHGRGKLNSENCVLWNRFSRRAKDIRKNQGIDFWVDVKCMDGEVRVLRYDRDDPPSGVDSRIAKPISRWKKIIRFIVRR